MKDEERWAMVCEPTLKRIEAKVDKVDGKMEKLTETVITGNGKPSLVARLTALEASAETAGKTQAQGQRSRSVKVGPVEINGYAMSDVLKVAIFVAFLGCIWLFLNDRTERVKVLKELHSTHQAMKTAANSGGTP
jgi:hypothetical protein